MECLIHIGICGLPWLNGHPYGCGSGRSRSPEPDLSDSDEQQRAACQTVCGTRIGALSPVRVEEEHPDVNTVTANLLPPPKVSKQGPAAINLDSSEVTASEKQELKQLLDEYRDVFANSDSEVGQTYRTQFRVNTLTQVPVAVKLQQTPFSLCSEIDQQIKNMEHRVIIKPFNSPYSAPILLLPKADGSYHFCAHFRALNDATITEIFPLFMNAWILFIGPIFSLL